MKLINKFVIVALALCSATSITKAQEWREWASTPPMGWNSYNCYGATIRESEFKENVDVQSAKLKDLGWEYAVIDFCWFYPHPKNSTQSNPPQFRLKDGSYVPWLAMDEWGRLYPAANKFPSALDGNGFKSIADYVHSKGLKFGIHVMRGVPRQAVWDKTPIKGCEGIDASMIADTTSTCNWLNSMYGVDMSKPGAQEYYDSVMELYAEWGVDFIKVDDISGGGKTPYYKEEAAALRKAIDKCGRPIVLSLSLNLKYEDREHLSQTANMWRISPDFWDNWEKVEDQFSLLEVWNDAKGEGYWPDADMLQLGTICRRGPKGEERQTYFTPAEQLTHMTLWAISKSPLMMGGDLTVMDEATERLLTNAEVIEINQHSVEGEVVSKSEDRVIWRAYSPDKKSCYVAVFNVSDSALTTKVDLKACGATSIRSIKELWSGESLKSRWGSLTLDIEPHSVAMLKVE